MFEDSTQQTIQLASVKLNTRIGGSGPPLLLLHGYPQTHIMWHKIAPTLAQHFTIICPDLRGYGDSDCPPSELAKTTALLRASILNMTRQTCTAR